MIADFSKNPVVFFLSCIVSAFLAGAGVILFLDQKIDTRIEAQKLDEQIDNRIAEKRIEKKIEEAVAGHTLDSSLLSQLPVGTIIAWDPIARNSQGQPNNETRTIPEGWLVCNGQNGTPNLVDRFLVGAADSSRSGITGGHLNLPAEGQHAHGGITGSFAGWIPGEINWDAKKGRHNPFHHRHSIGADGSHNHGGDNRPPFYSIIYLIKLDRAAE